MCGGCSWGWADRQLMGVRLTPCLLRNILLIFNIVFFDVEEGVPGTVGETSIRTPVPHPHSVLILIISVPCFQRVWDLVWQWIDIPTLCLGWQVLPVANGVGQEALGGH